MISRYFKVTLTIWLLFSIFSFGIFSYFAYFPQAILLIEAYQPGASYERARANLSDGNLEGAIKAYQRGVKYFKQLYGESGLERHQLYAGQGLLGIAGIYKNDMKPPDLEQAAEYYEEAIAWHPYWDKPIPNLLLGQTLIDAKKYSDAISPLTTSINLGYSPVSLKALFLRGLAFFQSGDYEKASNDWQNYLRFSWESISTQRWNQFLALRAKPVSTPASIYIQGRERFAREEPEESIEFFNQYQTEYPEDISSKYYLSVLNQHEINTGFGPRSFSSLFPPENDEKAIRLKERSLDVYASQDIEATLIVEIEFRGMSQAKQSVKFKLNSQYFDEVIGRFGETQIFKVNCSFLAGRNVLRIREENPVFKDDGFGVFLHSVTIDPKN